MNFSELYRDTTLNLNLTPPQTLYSAGGTVGSADLSAVAVSRYIATIATEMFAKSKNSLGHTGSLN